MSVKTIAIIHHVHTDFGYTDHPQRAVREHIQYIDRAIDYVLRSSDCPEGARFAWTQEQLYPLRLWWERASDAQKERFFSALGTGRLEITGTPFNVTAFLSREEWETAMRWISDDLWERCGIRSIVQIDVNGMHTGGMIEAHRRGIRNLFIGPNTYYGVPPMPTPAAFDWEIGEGRKLFVWLNASYNNGYFLFNRNWREGPVPDYADLRYRPPERGDIWKSDEESLLEAHRLCLENLAQIEGTADENTNATAETDGFTKNRVFGGYALETLPVSVTSQWRVDNDPPFYPIVDFVRRWNEMGLEPRLVLCTATQAIEAVRAELGEKIPVYRGEWVDWWANGNASSPVEMAYCRDARRTLRAAISPLFGPMKPEEVRTSREILENLCLYNEHSFGSWQSVSDPYSFAAVSQTAEKNILVYRALDAARCLLADRARAVTEKEKNAILVFNPSKNPVNAVIRLPRGCMRGEFSSVRCAETGEVFPIETEDGVLNFLRPSDPSEFGQENVSRTFSDKCEKQGVRFGPVTVPPMGRLRLIPGTEPAGAPVLKEKKFALETDADGWPVFLQFDGQKDPVIDGVFGDFLAVHADGFAPRWTFKDIFENDSEEERRMLRREHLAELPAEFEKAARTEAPGRILFRQEFAHGSLRYGVRELTIDLLNGRAELEVRFDRRSDFTPEVLFLRFDAPAPDELPTVSNAGVPFRPESDQLPGSCMDYYAIDGWIRWPNGWLLCCRDNAIAGFGSTGVVARKTRTDGPKNRAFIRLFDNLWDTNFRANASGQMKFRFSVCTGVRPDDAEKTAESMSAEPIVVVKTGYRSAEA